MAVVLNKQKLFQTFIIGIYEIKTALVICPEDIQKLNIEASAWQVFHGHVMEPCQCQKFHPIPYVNIGPVPKS